MKVKNVYILKEAVDDLDEGESFYDFQEDGVGGYFFDCIVSDIESLILYAGVHRKKIGSFSNVCQTISLCHLLQNYRRYCV